MSKKQNLLLFIIALIVAFIVAALQDAPGYMDADYYFSGGLRLAEGEGFTEIILWNFLDDPQGIPHPSHTYWMPLTSIVASLGLYIIPAISKFKAAQLGFILVFAVIPLITSELAFRYLADSRKAFFAGLLAIFSGFYLPFMTTTDAFGIYMLLGGLFFLRLNRLEKVWHYWILGLIAGLMHMTRADGLIWLLVALFVVWLQRKEGNVFRTGTFVLFGYLLVAFPWLWRNWQLSGSFMAPGGSRALFFLTYDEIFTFPASKLNFEHFWSAGFWNILQARWEAGLSNLQTGFAVQGLIFLGPLALISAWKKRKTLTIRVGWIAWGLTFFMMSIIFPFSGARGGFFHSGAAFMPLIWAHSINGLDIFISWIGNKRAWNIAQAKKVFQVGLIVLAILTSAFLTIQKSPTWTEGSNSYLALDAYLIRFGAKEEDIVLVNNPPSYYATTGRAAIVIPNGDPQTILDLAGKYHPQYLLLEVNHPAALDGLYLDPRSLPGLDYLDTVWDRKENYREDYFGTHIFRVSP